jgi:hypothetical protein
MTAPEPSRRDFMKTTGLAAAAATATLSVPRNVHAAGSNVLRVGLVGAADEEPAPPCKHCGPMSTRNWSPSATPFPTP